jgi:hypothetical protein
MSVIAKDDADRTRRYTYALLHVYTYRFVGSLVKYIKSRTHPTVNLMRSHARMTMVRGSAAVLRSSILARYQRAGLDLPSRSLLETAADKLRVRGSIAGTQAVWLAHSRRNSKRINFRRVRDIPISFLTELQALCRSTRETRFLLDLRDGMAMLLDNGVWINGRNLKAGSFCFFKPANQIRFGRIDQFVALDLDYPEYTIALVSLHPILSEANLARHIFVTASAPLVTTCVFVTDVIAVGALALHWYRRDLRCALVVDPPMVHHM